MTKQELFDGEITTRRGDMLPAGLVFMAAIIFLVVQLFLYLFGG